VTWTLTAWLLLVAGGGSGGYLIWQLGREWRAKGRLVDNLADIDAYSDELEPLPDEWDDQTLAELREPDGRQITEAINADPDEVIRLRAAREDARLGRLLPPEQDERLPEMLYADGYPVFASLLESAAWDAHWEQAWGELQRARESAWAYYHDAARCWAGVATGTFPAVTG
jgi:hypothetical protein